MKTSNFQSTAKKTIEFLGYQIHSHFQHLGIGGTVEVYEITKDGELIETFSAWQDVSSMESLKQVKDWIRSLDYTENCIMRRA